MTNIKEAIRVLQEMDALQDRLAHMFSAAPTTMTAQPLRGGAVRQSRKHTMSPALRKRLSLATKRRWAKARKAGKTSLGGK